MRKLILGAFIALTFAACKKEKDPTPAPGPGPGPDPGTPAKLLKRITKTENGQTTLYTLNYDDNKRLVSYTSNDQSEGLQFTYDNSGNVVKMEEQHDQVHNIYTYTYNNGVPVSGNFKSYIVHGSEQEELDENDDLTYTVQNGRVTKILMKMNLQQQEIPFVLTYTDGNVTRIQTEGSTAYAANFTYGNKKSGIPQVYKYVLDQAGFSLHFYAKNEVLSESYDFPGTQNDNSVTTTYTYDSDGYVLTSQEGNTKMVYEYQ
jgi:YD repeat-containing protein